MRPLLCACLVTTLASAGFADEGFKVQVLKEAPPSSLGAEIRGVLQDQGFRIVDEQGKTFADIWLRRAIPSSDKPAGPKGAIQFPFLADGELLGLCQFAAEARDYRDQDIAKGAYTMRFGLQPVNGDHLGVSTYRDYSLMLPASKDKSVAVPTRKQLEERSAESAGTSHPACFLLLMAPAGESKRVPAMIHDAEKSTWSVVLPLSLQVKGQTAVVVHPVCLVVVGTGPV